MGCPSGMRANPTGGGCIDDNPITSTSTGNQQTQRKRAHKRRQKLWGRKIRQGRRQGSGGMQRRFQQGGHTHTQKKHTHNSNPNDGDWTTWQSWYGNPLPPYQNPMDSIETLPMSKTSVAGSHQNHPGGAPSAHRHNIPTHIHQQHNPEESSYWGFGDEFTQYDNSSFNSSNPEDNFTNYVSEETHTSGVASHTHNQNQHRHPVLPPEHPGFGNTMQQVPLGGGQVQSINRTMQHPGKRSYKKSKLPQASTRRRGGRARRPVRGSRRR